MAVLAIDLHGGDLSPSVLFLSCITFFKNNPQHQGIVCGELSHSESFNFKFPANIRFIQASNIGCKAHKPALLLRRESDSSIEACFQAVANKQADAVVSAEHTGALMALMIKYGHMHSAIDRPVLASWLPTLTRPTLMLDLGASHTASHYQLLSYAAIAAGVLGQRNGIPDMAILNVGKEDFKGPADIRKAAESLEKWSNLNYVGFIEASKVFDGQVDAILCDGFTGNSVIKSAEGAASLVLSAFHDRLTKGIFKKLLGRWLKHELQGQLRRLDYRRANGALLAGSNLLVVKSHGDANEVSFESALSKAVAIDDQKTLDSVWTQLDWLLNSAPLVESHS